MTQVVYSTQLLNKPNGPAGTASWIVAVGTKVVVRDIDIVLQPTGAAVITATINGTPFWIVEVGFIGTFSYYSWRGRQVCDEPGAFDVTISDAGAILASGYVLQLP